MLTKRRVRRAGAVVLQVLLGLLALALVYGLFFSAGLSAPTLVAAIADAVAAVACFFVVVTAVVALVDGVRRSPEGGPHAPSARAPALVIRGVAVLIGALLIGAYAAGGPLPFGASSGALARVAGAAVVAGGAAAWALTLPGARSRWRGRLGGTLVVLAVVLGVAVPAFDHHGCRRLASDGGTRAASAWRASGTLPTAQALIRCETLLDRDRAELERILGEPSAPGGRRSTLEWGVEPGRSLFDFFGGVLEVELDADRRARSVEYQSE